VTAVKGVVKTYICPSSPRGTALLTAGYYVGEAAPTDYLLSVGANTFITTANPTSVDTSGNVNTSGAWDKFIRGGIGVFNVNSSTRIQRIRDGASNTILAGEGAGGPDLYAVTPLYASNANQAFSVANGRGAIGNDDEIAANTASVNSNVAVDTPWSQGYIPQTKDGSTFIGGAGSVFAASAWNAIYNADNTADSGTYGGAVAQGAPLPYAVGASYFWYPFQINMTRMRGTRASGTAASLHTGNLVSSGGGGGGTPTLAKNSAQQIITQISVGGFRSYHSQFCHFVFGDGSVRGVPDSIDGNVLAGLTTISGREIAELPETN
jgi:hypothetical protein